MLRSLNSGVTGLMNHQTRMDVIGNNIANVNTVGYKNRRVTFEESFNQLVKGASRTQSKAGGTNPMQIGLGVAVGSVDVITGQGNLSNTNRIFDLAIEGNAFFGVSDGKGTYYTRNGAFQLDAEGYIMLPTNGMVLQGRMADSYGNFPAGTAIGNLQIPMSQQAPAKETTEVTLGRNLNSEADAKGSVSYTQRMFAPADERRMSYEDYMNLVPPALSSLPAHTLPPNGANDPGSACTTLDSLYNSKGQSLNIKEGDVLTISWYSDATIVSGSSTPTELRVTVAKPTVPLTPNTVFDIEDLRVAIQTALNDSPLGTNHIVEINSDGSFAITHDKTPGSQIFNLQINSSNPLSNSYVNKAFNFGSHIGEQIGNYPANYGPVGVRSDILLRPAEQFDPMSDIRDANGNKLYPGLEGGDPIDVFGSVGKTSIEDGKSEALRFQPANWYDDANHEWVRIDQNSLDAWQADARTEPFWSKGANAIVYISPTDLADWKTANPGKDPIKDGDTIGVAPDFDPSNGFTTIKEKPQGDPTNIIVGGTTISATVEYKATLLDDLLAKIRNDFKLPAEYVDRDGVHISSVTMNPAGTDDGIPAGSIVIRGAKGADFSINNLSIRATNSNANQIAPTNFNAAMGVTEKRKAEDVGIAETVMSVYDESGAEHVLTVTFVHTGKAGEWEWSASFAGKEEIIPGSGTGKVTFGQDGTVSSWLFDNGGSQLIVDPRNGSNTMRINLNVGGPGDFRGLTQFASASTAQCTGQDGYPTGNLVEVTIDEFGVIEGAFSNGTSRMIAQIMVIDFANPGGLLDLSDSVYTTSANSGDPVWGLPINQSSSRLKPGALEMSNVDLAAEFTNMITTQKGYQANSRIITVSDTLLEELVNLKR